MSDSKGKVFGPGPPAPCPDNNSYESKNSSAGKALTVKSLSKPVERWIDYLDFNLLLICKKNRIGKVIVRTDAQPLLWANRHHSMVLL